MSNNPYSAEQSPDLGLAQFPRADVASGEQQASMPVPQLPPTPPSIKPYDIEGMGIVSNEPYFDLNLAQVRPMEKFNDAVAAGNQVNAPTFHAPDMSQPPVKPYDLVGPGIDLFPEFSPEPYVGDLLAFDTPKGLDITIASSTPQAIDPDVPDLSSYDNPNGLYMPSPMSVDPSLPDLQSPDLSQEVHMESRPGEMTDSDGDAPEVGPDGDDDDDDGPDYPETNTDPELTRRERHLNLVFKGLQGKVI